MNQKEAFKNGLIAVRKKAAANYNHTTVTDILSCFSGMELTAEQIAMIYRYLEEEHIIIEDYKPHDTRTVTVKEPQMTGEELAYFQMYLEDLKAIPPCSEAEEQMLIRNLLAGDESAQTRLIEGNLQLVLTMARRRVGSGVLIGDLVQEGNMALVMAVEEYGRAGVRISGQPLEDFLESRIDTAMKALIQEQGSNSHVAEKMAREANRLLEATAELEEELGREVSLSELGEQLHMSEEEIENVMRFSFSAMEMGDEATDGDESKDSSADPRRSGWAGMDDM